MSTIGNTPTSRSPDVGVHHPEFDRTIESLVALQIANAQRLSAPLGDLLHTVGVLSVTLHQAIGLSAPDQHWEPFTIQQQQSLAQLEGDSKICPWAGRSYQAHYKQYLPYAVLCFGQSRVFVASITGTTENPVWAQDAIVWKFDVFGAPQQLLVHLYLKSPDSDQPRTDIHLGMARIDPLSDERVIAGAIITEWLGVPGGQGAGQIRIGISYDPKGLTQVGSIKEVYSSTGLYSAVTPLRKQDTQQLYALKSIASAPIESATSLQSRIDSPFIAPLAFACQCDRELHLLLPFISGEHIFYRLQRDRWFDADQARFYAAELFCAFKHLHKLGIVYKGLQPKNILINSLGHITIVDHDLFLSDRVTQARAVDKTISYLAPEVLLGEAHSESSDWWTLGCIIYEMLTGTPPYYGEDDDRVRRNVSMATALDLPGTLSPSARDMLSALLRHNPDERLGANGPSDIEVHPFFHAIDWEKCGRAEYEPNFKPSRIATIFKDQAPPLVDIGEMFRGFSYTGPRSELGLLAVQDQVVAGNAPSVTRNSPHPGTHTDAALNEDADWELVWDEPLQAFILRDSRTNATRKIPSRRYFNTNRPPTLQEKKEEALEWVLAAHNTQAVHQLLNPSTMNLNVRFGSLGDCTPLEWAAECGDIPLVTLLLHHGADASFIGPSRTPAGARTALINAVAKRNQSLVRLLLPLTHHRVLRTRALGLAVDLCDEEVVDMLLASSGVQCDFDPADRPGHPRPLAGDGLGDHECHFKDMSFPEEFIPPLVRAVRTGSVPLVRLLLLHGADVNVGFHDLPRQLSSEYSPPFRLVCGRVVQLAMTLGHGEIVRMLLRAGADVGLAQPNWRGHWCEMIPRREYLEITAGLKAAVDEMGVQGP